MPLERMSQSPSKLPFANSTGRLRRPSRGAAAVAAIQEDARRGFARYATGEGAVIPASVHVAAASAPLG